MATLHRPWNGDGMDQLVSLVHMLAELSRHLPIVFPVHPAGQTADAGCRARRRGLILTEPLGYLEFLGLTSAARLVLTDSWGIQEETTILPVECLTMRENTERAITITERIAWWVRKRPRFCVQPLDTLQSPPRCRRLRSSGTVTPASGSWLYWSTLSQARTSLPLRLERSRFLRFGRPTYFIVTGASQSRLGPRRGDVRAPSEQGVVLQTCKSHEHF